MRGGGLSAHGGAAPAVRAAATAQSPARRSDFLDRIRLALSALVILHHSAIMFGAPGGWYIRFSGAGLAERVLFTVFVSVDQAFFMGFFFLLAGYFSVASYERKGAPAFLRDRLLRLGMPILVYGWVLGPFTVALARTARGRPLLAGWAGLVRHGVFEIGPLWFAWALLLFSAAYAGWRRMRPRATGGVPARPRHGQLLAAALGTGLLAFLLRQWVPVGQQRWGLQIGYFASYAVLFAGGCAAARGRWLERVDAALARPWVIVAVFTLPLLFVYGALAGAARGVPFDTDGGWTLPVLAYALWEPFVAWGIILGMLWRFRAGAVDAPRWRRWTPCAYAAYIVHPPLLVGAGVLLGGTALPNSMCWLLAGAAAIVLSFALARLLLRVPGAGRVL